MHTCVQIKFKEKLTIGNSATLAFIHAQRITLAFSYSGWQDRNTPKHLVGTPCKHGNDHQVQSSDPSHNQFNSLYLRQMCYL